MWTRFMDMHSGGGNKEKWAHIYIEAPEDEARVIFYNRFGHNPERVSCTCCGEDYGISSGESLSQLTGFDRGCASLETPRDERGLYKEPDDPWFRAHYYLEADEHEEAERRGWTVDMRYSSYREYRTLEDYTADPSVLVIHADEIKPDERKGSVPEQGYVW